MRLSRVELKGFKSFAGRTVLEPSVGMTCVVGPNGSGKSNITDAIRWVLGEQGARVLRGEKMEDIIFSGTKKRAGLGFAEVKLSFDNADMSIPLDFETVEISRRLYRSGESEYKINDASVRLKDIRDLFQDTGLGLEGYSIIGQGRIDEIIGASAADRRLLFDEAAGVTSYKQKKVEAERKLGAAESDLSDLSIRLSESEAALSVLKEEADRAQRYLTISDRIRAIRVFEYGKKYRSARTSLERAVAQEQEATAAKQQAEREIRDCEARVLSAAERVREVRERLKLTDSRRYDIAGEIRSLETNILLGREKKHSAERALRTFEESLEKERATAVERDTRIATLSSEVILYEQSVRELEEQTAVLSDRVGENSGALAELRQTVEQSKERNLVLGNRTAVLVQKKEENLELLASLEKEEAVHDLEAMRARVNELEHSVKRIEEAERDNSEQVARAKENVSDLNGRIAELDRELISANATLSFEKERAESYEDYEKSVRTLVKNKPDDLLGVVGDLFTTTKQYEVAIETALGKNINILVCEKAKTAKKYIQFLKDNKLGRASFMPLDDLGSYRDRRNTEIAGKAGANDVAENKLTADGGLKSFQALQESMGQTSDSRRHIEQLLARHGLANYPGFEGVASDFVECDDRYRIVFENLLGSIVIASDFEAGRTLVRLGKRVVTLSGEVFLPTGIITGGATKRGTRILSRKRIISDLERKIADCQAEQQSLQKKLLEEQDALDGLKKDRTSLFERLEQSRLRYSFEKSTFEKAVQEEEERKQRGLETLSRIREENQEIAEELAECRAERKNIERTLGKNTSAIAKLEKELSDKTISLTELKINHARVSEKLEASKKQYEMLQAEREQLALEHGRADAEIGVLTEQLVQLTKAEEELAAKKEQLLPMMEETNQLVKELEGRLQTLEQEHVDSNEQSKKAFEALREAEEFAMKKATETVRFEGALSLIESELMTQCEMTAEEAMNADKVEIGAVPEWAWSDPERPAEDAFSPGEQVRSDGSDLLGEGVPSLSDTGFADSLEREIEQSSSRNISKYTKQSENSTSFEFKSLSSELKFYEEELATLSDASIHSIKEYEQRLLRQSELSREREETLRAVYAMKALIEEISEQIEQKFKLSFEKTEVAFDTAFKRLFGGGEAKLVLKEQDGSDFAGVEIAVQPPGKKLKSLSLLSGGEKALTAIALLFAFMEQRPSPFYVLDEIEAALDDVNLVKFTDFLDEYSKSAQFLVITHRRGTMDIADAVFGVTMEEYGVSKVISTKLA